MLGKHTKRTIEIIDASKKAEMRTVILKGMENLYRKSKAMPSNGVQTEEQKNIEELNLKMQEDIEKIEALKETKQIAQMMLALIPKLPKHTLNIEKTNGYDRIKLVRRADGSLCYKRIQGMEEYGSNSQKANENLTGKTLIDFVEENLGELNSKFEKRKKVRLDLDEI